MNYLDIKTSILAQFMAPEGHKTSFLIQSEPGSGKSSLARDVARELQNRFGIPDERVVEFNPSLRESCDLLGLPDNTGVATRWAPPLEFYVIRKGQGPSVLILEEMTDADMSMQNPLCRVILDRHAGQMPLSEQLFIIATGNRVEDRSGAQRLSTKLANRMRILNFDTNLDAWLEWAETHGIRTELQQFLRWKPNLLSEFDPQRQVNPTPRSWEDANRVPLPDGVFTDNMYRENLKGCVGEGPATEFVGFCNLLNKFKGLEKVFKRPDIAPVPKQLDVLYALVGRIVDYVKKPEDFEFIWAYLKRIEQKEFVTMAVKMLIKRGVPIQGTKAWDEFVSELGDAICGAGND